MTREQPPRLAILSLALWQNASGSILTATSTPGAVAEIGDLAFVGHRSKSG